MMVIIYLQRACLMVFSRLFNNKNHSRLEKNNNPTHRYWYNFSRDHFSQISAFLSEQDQAAFSLVNKEIYYCYNLLALKKLEFSRYGEYINFFNRNITRQFIDYRNASQSIFKWLLQTMQSEQASPEYILAIFLSFSEADAFREDLIKLGSEIDYVNLNSANKLFLSKVFQRSILPSDFTYQKYSSYFLFPLDETSVEKMMNVLAAMIKIAEENPWRFEEIKQLARRSKCARNLLDRATESLDFYQEFHSRTQRLISISIQYMNHQQRQELAVKIKNDLTSYFTKTDKKKKSLGVLTELVIYIEQSLARSLIKPVAAIFLESRQYQNRESIIDFFSLLALTRLIKQSSSIKFSQQNNKIYSDLITHLRNMLFIKLITSGRNVEDKKMVFLSIDLLGQLASPHAELSITSFVVRSLIQRVFSFFPEQVMSSVICWLPYMPADFVKACVLDLLWFDHVNIEFDPQLLKKLMIVLQSFLEKLLIKLDPEKVSVCLTSTGLWLVNGVIGELTAETLQLVVNQYRTIPSYIHLSCVPVFLKYADDNISQLVIANLYALLESVGSVAYFCLILQLGFKLTGEQKGKITSVLNQFLSKISSHESPLFIKTILEALVPLLGVLDEFPVELIYYFMRVLNRYFTFNPEDQLVRADFRIVIFKLLPYLLGYMNSEQKNHLFHLIKNEVSSERAGFDLNCLIELVKLAPMLDDARLIALGILSWEMVIDNSISVAKRVAFLELWQSCVSKLFDRLSIIDALYPLLSECQLELRRAALKKLSRILVDPSNQFAVNFYGCFWECSGKQENNTQEEIIGDLLLKSYPQVRATLFHPTNRKALGGTGEQDFKPAYLRVND